MGPARCSGTRPGGEGLRPAAKLLATGVVAAWLLKQPARYHAVTCCASQRQVSMGVVGSVGVPLRFQSGMAMEVFAFSGVVVGM